ncbi:TetR/AcrR family transcriptional regulator [Streptomyces sp. CBMA152]|uniref:TetR/AcrR family transcriptional regulator n=1 Tax=Streptomyces sp. CBMA152 TaxID=1896312 RepID=UPI0016613314|nr:TetR/AcrR family transcriptional regulator [Streptomyces sp. CBMA152]MBD0744076.1 TetR family transcriptional regulator [Streptomyces sp. CBMA152]
MVETNEQTGGGNGTGMGLRERKKLQTQLRLMGVAIELFTERGYDKVSVAEIAEAAEVSKMTVFNHFGNKEDLALRPVEEHIHDAARTVRDRAPGESAVQAMRRHYLRSVDERDPSIGMSDTPLVLQLLRLIMETPVLLTRAHAALVRSSDLVAEVLAEETGDQVMARVAAAQLMAVRATLISENYRRLLLGDPADAIAPDAVRLAIEAFDLVEHGLGDYATKAEAPA